MPAKITELITEYCFDDDLCETSLFMTRFNKKLLEEKDKKTSETLSATFFSLNYDVCADMPTLTSGGMLISLEVKIGKQVTPLSRSVVTGSTKAVVAAGAASVQPVVAQGEFPSDRPVTAPVVDAPPAPVTSPGTEMNVTDMQSADAGHFLVSLPRPQSAPVSQRPLSQGGAGQKAPAPGEHTQARNATPLRVFTASMPDSSANKSDVLLNRIPAVDSVNTTQVNAGPVVTLQPGKVIPTSPGMKMKTTDMQSADAGHFLVSLSRPQSAPVSQRPLSQGGAGQKAPAPGEHTQARNATPLRVFTASMPDSSANKSDVLLNRIPAVDSVNTTQVNAGPVVTMQPGKVIPEVITAPAAVNVNKPRTTGTYTALETTRADNRYAPQQENTVSAVSTGEPKSTRDKSSLRHALTEGKPDETIHQFTSLSLSRDIAPGVESSRATNPSRTLFKQRDVTARNPMTENLALELNYKFQRWTGDHSVRVSLLAEDKGNGSLLLKPSGSRVVDALSSQFDQLTSYTPKLVEATRDDDERQQQENQDEETE